MQEPKGYDSETNAYFRQRIQLALEGVRLRIRNNHHNEPQFLEDLKSWEKRTGEDKEELRKHHILNGQSEEQEKDLEAALVRVDKGTYPFCEWPGCGETIPFDRHDAILQAKYCLRHQVEVSKSKERGRKTRY